MFTGLVQEVGRIAQIHHRGAGLELVIQTGLAESMAVGDSIAVDGCCQTATRIAGDRVHVFAMRETLARTTLGRLKPGRRVNLELARTLGDRMGGHIVQGHVDGVANVSSVEPRGDSTLLVFRLPHHLARYAVPQGSICLAGVSLTLVEVDGATASVALVPHTLSATNLGDLRGGDPVNVEMDVLAKYVERLVRVYLADRPNAAGSRLTTDDLRNAGF